MPNRRHNHSRSSGITPEYRAWINMRARCGNPKHVSYPNYGARGISVCDAWRSDFKTFLADVGPRPSPEHTLDRVDNEGNYEPGNCRWATEDQQRANRRCSRYVEFAGKRLTVAEWGRETGMGTQALLMRLNRGWSTERAITEPIPKRAEAMR